MSRSVGRRGVRRSVLAVASALLLVGATCDDGGPTPPPTGSPQTDEEALRDSDALAARICRRPEPPDGGAPAPGGEVPPAVAEVMDQVEQVRELDFREPVVAEPVTQEEIGRRLARYLDYSFPEAILGPRSLAWATMGVIPEGTSLRAVEETFATGQVIGFYDPASKELVFAGSEEPTAIERLTLAHELTHAMDDQHFDLERLNELEADCLDADLQAGIGAVEGSAQLFSLQVAQRFFSVEDLTEIFTDPGEPPDPSIPPFVLELKQWPYLTGFTFVSSRYAEGGVEAVNQAIEELPDSTEQVIHPGRYPDDDPQAVGVPDLAGALGGGWKDLDIYEVGEDWLSAALGLRLGDAEAREGAAGWDGGRYRAWANGDRVAVALVTVWDTGDDAGEFAGTMRRWLDQGETVGEVVEDGDRVTVLWAPEEDALAAMVAGLG